ncbi:MAG TPA: S-formylglutathione hydrolase [Steroidobacteraceae bacterium]|jgi:S-formylglutathione hydrolase|nr:S-formylglutathione hydrolase [Steroidobacteraceae bacterium]
MLLATLSRHACFGGVLGYYQHPSQANNCDMRFAVYSPPQAATGPVPVLYYLAGLTCTEETFVTKAGALEHAARHGIMLVAPDTSPRVTLPGDRESWDFGVAAGFYLDATQAPWSSHYRMYSYVVDELPGVIARNFKADIARSGIMGHSMGGHGALTIALKNPQKYKSLSAFAPIAAPIQSPWGNKAFTGYLGAYRADWAQYDATELVKAGHKFPGGILIDQGTADKFLADQLKPELLVSACKAAGQEVYLQMREGYDHGYFFIQSFISQHMTWHSHLLAK